MELSYKIKPEFKHISDIKKDFSTNLIANGFSFTYDIEMGFTELMENAIKYSENDAKEDIKIEIKIENRHLSICITNYIKGKDDLNSLSTIIKRIESIGKSKNLYLERINEIINQDGIGISQLGLYRIVYEGEYNLSYTVDKDHYVSISIDKNI